MKHSVYKKENVQQRVMSYVGIVKLAWTLEGLQAILSTTIKWRKRKDGNTASRLACCDLNASKEWIYGGKTNVKIQPTCPNPIKNKHVNNPWPV